MVVCGRRTHSNAVYGWGSWQCVLTSVMMRMSSLLDFCTNPIEIMTVHHIYQRERIAYLISHLQEEIQYFRENDLVMMRKDFVFTRKDLRIMRKDLVKERSVIIMLSMDFHM